MLVVHRLLQELKLQMPLDKDAEFEKARDALIAGNMTGFEAIREQVSYVSGSLALKSDSYFGRAAARCIAPKLLRVIRAGLNGGGEGGLGIWQRRASALTLPRATRSSDFQSEDMFPVFGRQTLRTHQKNTYLFAFFGLTPTKDADPTTFEKSTFWGRFARFAGAHPTPRQRPAQNTGAWKRGI